MKNLKEQEELFKAFREMVNEKLYGEAEIALEAMRRCPEISTLTVNLCQNYLEAKLKIQCPPK